jgi:hypothetical protein
MVRTPSSPVSERDKEREKKRERERGRERKREGGREMYNMVMELISLLLTMAAFLFSKGMTGALAPFGYLVINKNEFDKHGVCPLWHRIIPYLQLAIEKPDENDENGQVDSRFKDVPVAVGKIRNRFVILVSTLLHLSFPLSKTFGTFVSTDRYSS